jgi:hypothetical protein
VPFAHQVSRHRVQSVATDEERSLDLPPIFSHRHDSSVSRLSHVLQLPAVMDWDTLAKSGVSQLPHQDGPSNSNSWVPIFLLEG